MALRFRPTLGEHLSIGQIERINDEAGNHFFKPATLRFFSSRVCADVFTGADGWYFVTSERSDERHPRLYTVRKMGADGDIDTVGDFQQYRSRSGALAAAQRLARASKAQTA